MSQYPSATDKDFADMREEWKGSIPIKGPRESELEIIARLKPRDMADQAVTELFRMEASGITLSRSVSALKEILKCCVKS